MVCSWQLVKSTLLRKSIRLNLGEQKRRLSKSYSRIIENLILKSERREEKKGNVMLLDYKKDAESSEPQL